MDGSLRLACRFGGTLRPVLGTNLKTSLREMKKHSNGSLTDKETEAAGTLICPLALRIASAYLLAVGRDAANHFYFFCAFKYMARALRSSSGQPASLKHLFVDRRNGSGATAQNQSLTDAGREGFWTGCRKPSSQFPH